jgi:hypothetical protein
MVLGVCPDESSNRVTCTNHIGCSNSIWGKFQDMQCVENCSDPDPRKRVLFEQPVWQTLQMFAGEVRCYHFERLLVFYCASVSLLSIDVV